MSAAIRPGGLTDNELDAALGVLEEEIIKTVTDLRTMAKNGGVEGLGWVLRTSTGFKKVIATAIIDELAVLPDELETEGAQEPEPEGAQEPEPEADDPELEAEESETGIYSKFEGGYFGSFASLKDFRGGLQKLLGARPDANAIVAMQREHCEIAKPRFGASDAEFVTSNYGGNRTTPKNEWMHVADPENAPRLMMGRDHNGKDLGTREKVTVAQLRCKMLERIKKCFVEIGWVRPAEALTQSKLDELELEDAELIGIRLYTGPCYMLYNAVLRAMGNPEQPGFVQARDRNFGGMDARGCFVTTLHNINHGVIKLSYLSDTTRVYRGLAGMKLPETFLTPDATGVRAGVEYGFMSTTANEEVALGYSKGSDGAPRTVFAATMNAASRGAFVGWLSQYPDEVEFLYAPLCCLEIPKGTHSKTVDGVLRFEMNFHQQQQRCEPVAGMEPNAHDKRDRQCPSCQLYLPSRAYSTTQWRKCGRCMACLSNGTQVWDTGLSQLRKIGPKQCLTCGEDAEYIGGCRPHVGTWHDDFSKCGIMCVRIGLQNLGSAHWGCCFKLGLNDPCTQRKHTFPPATA
eukprot:SAG31_NODE_2813_length_5048_cov_8.252576_2_plen_574_part_00